MFSIADHNNFGGKFPNLTLLGFQDLMTSVNSLAGIYMYVYIYIYIYLYIYILYIYIYYIYIYILYIYMYI
jgi:hypothetical protein